MKKQTIFAATAAIALTLGQAPLASYAFADNPHNNLIVGTVNPNGTSQTATNAFTIAHIGPGHYKITFDPRVFGSNVPACLVMPLGSLTVSGIFENVGFCDLYIVNLSGTPTDAYFNFMAGAITKTIKLDD